MAAVGQGPSRALPLAILAASLLTVRWYHIVIISQNKMILLKATAAGLVAAALCWMLGISPLNGATVGTCVYLVEGVAKKDDEANARHVTTQS